MRGLPSTRLMAKGPQSLNTRWTSTSSVSSGKPVTNMAALGSFLSSSLRFFSDSAYGDVSKPPGCVCQALPLLPLLLCVFCSDQGLVRLGPRLRLCTAPGLAPSQQHHTVALLIKNDDDVAILTRVCHAPRSADHSHFSPSSSSRCQLSSSLLNTIRASLSN